MNRAPDPTTLIHHAQTTFEEVRDNLQATDSLLQTHISRAHQLKQHTQRNAQPAKALAGLHQQAIEQVRRAQYSQSLPAATQEPDPLTRFARQVRRNRQLV